MTAPKWSERAVERHDFPLPALDWGASYVYVAWGPNRKRPLYVGKSRVLLARLGSHSRDSEWWPRLRHLEVYAYPSEDEALEAEAQAISELQPEYNRMGIDQADKRPYHRPPLDSSKYGPRVKVDDFTADQLEIIRRVQDRVA